MVNRERIGCSVDLGADFKADLLEHAILYLLSCSFNESTDSQNRKYLCAIGSSFAGSQVSSTPSALTS